METNVIKADCQDKDIKTYKASSHPGFLTPEPVIVTLYFLSMR